MKNRYCPITGERMEKLFSKRLLNKYDVDYFYSEKSKIIMTETPYWLDEAYKDAIASTDVGLVNRNIQNKDKVIFVLNALGIPNGKYVDLAGGYGLFTRLMRDAGYDFHSTDPYCKNIFAKLHEPTDTMHAEALTAFEVLEHVDNPLAFVESGFQKYNCQTLICSTLDYGNKIPKPDWWYWTCHTGQHICFYNATTLRMLAEKLGCQYIRMGSEFHVFTKLKVPVLKKMIFRHRKARKLYEKIVKYFVKRDSLLLEDYKLAVRISEQEQGS